MTLARPTEGLSPSLLPFAVRLRDLLSTLESAALLGAVEGRVRGLGEQLRFACLALPCEEAVVALEVEALGRLRVPVVATADGFRNVDVEFLPSGTPFAFLLSGGGGHAVDLAPNDAMISVFAPCLATAPRSALFIPIRIGEHVGGGLVLLSSERVFGDRDLVMAERLGEVLALTVESFRTERVVFELFALALPDLLGRDAATPLGASLVAHIHALRLTPAYRRRLELAALIGRVADQGSEEARLALELLRAVDRYVVRADSSGNGGGVP